MKPAELLQRTGHRTWPPPARPWSQRQSWLDLLFAHWPVDADAVRELLPAGLELDLFEGQAWLGVLPFHMQGIRFRSLPLLPGTSAFAELNVRTYVRATRGPGIWFFSLDAAHALAVAVARRWYHLPYFRARMSSEGDGEAVRYRSTRTHRGAPAAELAAEYAPSGAVEPARPGTLEHWLVERYRLYARHGSRILEGEVHHDPWPLQKAVASFRRNTMAAASGLRLPDVQPVLHFSRRLDVLVWSPQSVG